LWKEIIRIDELPFSTKIAKLYVCSHAFVLNSLSQFTKFHHYPVFSPIVVLKNHSEEDVFNIGTYHLKLRGGNKLLLHDALYAPRMRCSLVSSFVSLMQLNFSFGFHPNGLDILYNGNLFITPL